MASNPPSANAPLPSGWKEAFDEKHNRWYFYNPSTKQSQWHHPAATSTAEKKSVWVEKFDERYKRPYWYNRKTKQSSWTKPAEEESDSSTSRTPKRKAGESLENRTDGDSEAKQSGAENNATSAISKGVDDTLAASGDGSRDFDQSERTGNKKSAFLPDGASPQTSRFPRKSSGSTDSIVSPVTGRPLKLDERRRLTLRALASSQSSTSDELLSIEGDGTRGTPNLSVSSPISMPPKSPHRKRGTDSARIQLESQHHASSFNTDRDRAFKDGGLFGKQKLAAMQRSSAEDIQVSHGYTSGTRRHYSSKVPSNESLLEPTSPVEAPVERIPVGAHPQNIADVGEGTTTDMRRSSHRPARSGAFSSILNPTGSKKPPVILTSRPAFSSLHQRRMGGSRSPQNHQQSSPSEEVVSSTQGLKTDTQEEGIDYVIARIDTPEQEDGLDNFASNASSPLNAVHNEAGLFTDFRRDLGQLLQGEAEVEVGESDSEGSETATQKELEASMDSMDALMVSQSVRSSGEVNEETVFEDELGEDPDAQNALDQEDLDTVDEEAVHYASAEDVAGEQEEEKVALDEDDGDLEEPNESSDAVENVLNDVDGSSEGEDGEPFEPLDEVEESATRTPFEDTFEGNREEADEVEEADDVGEDQLAEPVEEDEIEEGGPTEDEHHGNDEGIVEENEHHSEGFIDDSHHSTEEDERISAGEEGLMNDESHSAGDERAMDDEHHSVDKEVPLDDEGNLTESETLEQAEGRYSPVADDEPIVQEEAEDRTNEIGAAAIDHEEETASNHSASVDESEAELPSEQIAAKDDEAEEQTQVHKSEEEDAETGDSDWTNVPEEPSPEMNEAPREMAADGQVEIEATEVQERRPSDGDNESLNPDGVSEEHIQVKGDERDDDQAESLSEVEPQSPTITEHNPFAQHELECAENEEARDAEGEHDQDSAEQKGNPFHDIVPPSTEQNVETDSRDAGNFSTEQEYDVGSANVGDVSVKEEHEAGLPEIVEEPPVEEVDGEEEPAIFSVSEPRRGSINVDHILMRQQSLKERMEMLSKRKRPQLKPFNSAPLIRTLSAEQLANTSTALLSNEETSGVEEELQTRKRTTSRTSSYLDIMKQEQGELLLHQQQSPVADDEEASTQEDTSTSPPAPLLKSGSVKNIAAKLSALGSSGMIPIQFGAPPKQPSGTFSVEPQMAAPLPPPSAGSSESAPVPVLERRSSVKDMAAKLNQQSSSAGALPIRFGSEPNVPSVRSSTGSQRFSLPELHASASESSLMNEAHMTRAKIPQGLRREPSRRMSNFAGT